MRIERLFRGFLWGSLGGGRGVHLVAWESICLLLREGGLGVVSLMERREQLLARHASRFILEPQGFWSRIMTIRYGGAGPEGWARGGRSCSFLWREIARYLPLVSSHTRWLIGDGRSIDVAGDPWVDGLPLRLWPTMVSVETEEGLLVCDLMTPGAAGWDEIRLASHFGQHLAERVRSLSFPQSGGPDVCVWRSSSRSRVRMGDLSRIIRREYEPCPDCVWIWRLKLHPRVALFLWKVVWDRLPTRAVLGGRGMRIPLVCEDCGVAEIVDHALFRCSWARSTWRLAGVPQEVWHCRDLFLQAMRQGSESPTLRQEAVRASCTAYQIWLARNARTFGERRMSPRFVVEKARVQAAELCYTIPVKGTLIARDIWGSHSASAAFRTVFFTWEPPPPSFLKVNFDGSVLDSGTRGGAGFVIRDPSARVVAAGGSQLFDTSVPCAELRAAWAGIRHARCVLQARSIILEGDSATVISWIQRGPRGGGSDHPLLRDIWAMARDGWAFQARHIYREGNGAAD